MPGFVNFFDQWNARRSLPQTDAERSIAALDAASRRLAEQPAREPTWAETGLDYLNRVAEWAPLRGAAERFAENITDPNQVTLGFPGETQLRGFIGGAAQGAAELLTPEQVALAIPGPHQLPLGAYWGGKSAARAAAGYATGAPTSEVALESINALLGAAGAVAGGSRLAVEPRPTFRGREVSLPVGRHSIFEAGAPEPRSREYTPFRYQDIGTEVPPTARPVGPAASQRPTRPSGALGQETPLEDIEALFFRDQPRQLPPGEPPEALGPGATPLGPSPLAPEGGAPFSVRGPFVGGIAGERPAPPVQGRPIPPAGYLPEQAGPSRTAAGALEMPGETRPFGPTFEPFRSPEGYPRRTVLDELAGEPVGQPIRPIEETISSGAPEPPKAPSADIYSVDMLPESVRLKRPQTVLGRNVREVTFENGQPFLIDVNGERMRVPWDVVDILREQDATLPPRPHDAPEFMVRPAPRPVPPPAPTLAQPTPLEKPLGTPTAPVGEALPPATVAPEPLAPAEPVPVAAAPEPAAAAPVPGETPRRQDAIATVAREARAGVPEPEPVDPTTLQLDPETYQFKESDAAGVTGALRGVTKWEPMAPPIAVHERLDGSRYIADGHQRFNKYLELAQQGQPMPPLSARVFREADGWSVEAMRRLASLRNIQEGSAQPLDIARLIWNGGDLTPDELARVPKNAVVGDRLARGQALGTITDPQAQRILLNKEVNPEYAAYVGKYITDPAEQLAALQKLAAADLDNMRQAEAFVQSLAEAEFEQQSILDMFGGQNVAVPLAETKAKLLDAARRALTERKAAFTGAVRHAGKLAQAGNQLVGEVNVANLTEAKKLLAYFDKFARVKGTHTNDALTDAARAIVRGEGDRNAALPRILEAVERDLRGEPVPERAGLPPGRPEEGAGAGGDLREPGGPGEPGGLTALLEPEAPPPAPVAAPPVAAPAPPARAPMKVANNGEFLAPEGKDYVFVKLDTDFAHGNPELRKNLQLAGYRYRSGQKAWFKDLGEMTHVEAEDEAARLLGGVKGTDILDTGEVQPRLPGDVGEARTAAAAPEPQIEAPFSLSRELSGDRPTPRQTSVFEAPAPSPLEEMLQPAAKQARPAPEAVTTVAPEGPTVQQIPANTRSFLKRQLGYSDEAINAMSPDEAMAAAEGRVRAPSPVETPVESPVESRPVSPVESPVESAPESLEELLTGYLRDVAPTKVEQAQRRMKAAQVARGKEKVPVEQTYRGGAPEESEMAVPRREAQPYRPQSLKDVKAREAAGIEPEAAEQALEQAAPAKGELRKQLVEARQPLTEQEMKARGIEPPARETSRHPGALEKGGLTRANARRANAMQRMLERGDRDAVDEYARALVEQIERENEQAFKWGTQAGQEGKKTWGEDFTRLKFDKDTGEYLGSGFGAIEAMWKANPGLVLRSGGGALAGLILGDKEGLDGPALLGAGLVGAAAGAAGPAALRRIAQIARAEMPTVARSMTKLWKTSKAEARANELKVRQDRDYGKDISVAQMWRSIHTVDPDLFRDIFQITKESAKKVAAETSPETKNLIQKLYQKQVVGEIRTSAKVAESIGHKNEARYLRKYADMVAGVPTDLAKLVANVPIGMTPQQFQGLLNQVGRQTYRTLIGFAVDTALVNATQVALAIPRIGFGGVVRGVARAMTKAGKAEAAAAGLHFETFADLPSTPQGKILDAIDRAAFGMMQWSDEFNRRATYLGAKDWAKARGHAADAAEQFAQDLTIQTQGIPGDLAGNPFLHQFGPLRALAKYPTLYAEFVSDVLRHPDAAVRYRALGYLTGAAALSAISGVNLMDMLIPRLSVFGPVVDASKRLFSEEELRHLPGGLPAGHSILEDVGSVLTPRYAKKVAGVVQARLPESVGGYGETGTRPVIGRKGQDTGATATPLEDIANLVGVTTERQTASTTRTAAENVVRRAIGAPEKPPGEREQINKAYEFEIGARAVREQASDKAKRNLRDAIERNDEEDIRAAAAELTPGQLREFYRSHRQSPIQRIERRLPRNQREEFRRRMGLQ